MHLLKTTLILLIVIYLAMLFSGYGFLISSRNNLGGLGLQCQYLTARSLVTQTQIHDSNGVIGIAECPLFKAISSPLDQ
ncbi:hypothetical protein QMU90_003069 [Edwardsiella ictaluri]|uniref:Uncharacterized protein YobH n=2 Tax=Edwardsiella ictaluri TaxID=67780 RepID=A0ABY8GFZ4_EDWIC|nr:YobH family protein [Edwardsiella ictaluri]ARD38415.1 hypothetical protein B6E78_02440 [Edwardsiella ictaluri]ELV7529153.1 hypothetical protein [Edwardsiella ictaluri]KMQ77806.1 hypothetical protein ABY58_12470 [Edwardsiella ictaluri]KOO54627.1 hypothetical protein ACS33_12630 [Edwardsiella ictaluri]QPW26833.1 hypothetical protein F8538_08380 [Edwardsiella ictaluri]